MVLEILYHYYFSDTKPLTVCSFNYDYMYRHYYYSEQITIGFTVQFGCQSIISLLENGMIAML